MERKEFANLKFITNRRGVVWGNDYIMRAWEKKQIECQAKSIMKKYKPKSILEFGYGLGYTANIFKKADRHLIVELNKGMAQKARDAGFDVWEGAAQDFKSDEHFDIIYDDRYDMIDDSLDFLKNINHDKFLTLDLCSHTQCRSTITIL